MPLALVVAVAAGVNPPPVVLKVTLMFGSGWLALSRTVAVRLVLPVPTGMFALPAATVIVLTTALLLLTDMFALLNAPVLATALIESVPSVAPAV